jgi:oxygen-independent coproporphyrinogen-3 oxidase
MGIQTFDDIQLKKINRRHTGIDAINAYQNARKAGFNNISVDLIYGLPDQHLQNWEIQLKKAIEIHPEHISVYGLTYEPGTPLHKQRELGKVTNATDEIMIEMHLKALELLQKAGYEAYEVSNYALKGFRSQHNSAYWKGQKYLGIGPSAHSFDGNSRQWNLSSLKDYNHAIENNLTFFEREELSIQDKYNEYIMVGLRTAEGVNIEFISQQFDIDYANYFIDKSASYINSHKMLQQENQFSLTTSGLLISNTIIEDLIRIS